MEGDAEDLVLPGAVSLTPFEGSSTLAPNFSNAQRLSSTPSTESLPAASPAPQYFLAPDTVPLPRTTSHLFDSLPAQPRDRQPSLMPMLGFQQRRLAEPFQSTEYVISGTEKASETWKPHGEQMQELGCNIFYEYETNTLELYQALLMLNNAARSLGSTYILLKCADVIRSELLFILDTFSGNASNSLSGVRNPSTRLPSIRSALHKRQRLEGPWENRESGLRPPLPVSLNSLADSLDEFLEHVNEVSEYAEENLNIAVERCTKVLRYRASCLKDFQDRLSDPDIALYVNDVSGIVGEQLGAVAQAVSNFLANGISTIRQVQDQKGTAYQNLSTVATLTSAVAATVLQFAYTDHNPGAARRMNILWITSLTFSVASAINSQLAYYWLRSFYRTPSLRMATFGSLVILRAPVVFFALAIVAFSGGLVAFAFVQFGGTALPGVVIGFTTITVGTMVFAAIWIIREMRVQLAFRARELGNVSFDAAKESCAEIRSRFKSLFTRTTRDPVRKPRPDSLDGAYLEEQKVDSRLSSLHAKSLSPSPAASVPVQQHVLMQASKGPLEQGQQGWLPPLPAIAIQRETSTGPMHDDLITKPLSANVEPANRGLSTVTQHGQLLFPDAGIKNPPVPVSGPFTLIGPDATSVHGIQQEHSFTSIIRALRDPSMRAPLWTLRPYTSPVRQIEFAPDGEYLASCGWDPDVYVWHLPPGLRGQPAFHRRLSHTGCKTIKSIAWSPSPDHRFILTLFGKSIRLWDIDSESSDSWAELTRPHEIRSISWITTGDCFLLVEGSDILTIDVQDSRLLIRQITCLGRIPQSISVIDAIPLIDNSRMLILFTVDAASDGRIPPNAPERRIALAPGNSELIVDELPLVRPARHLVASPDEGFAVVTFCDSTPPQYFRCRDQAKGLSMTHAFVSPSTANFTGRTSVGSFCSRGVPDQIIFGADEDGNIFLWNCKTGALIYTWRTVHEPGRLLSVAWNHASAHSLMFATASSNGLIRIWWSPVPTRP